MQQDVVIPEDRLDETSSGPALCSPNDLYALLRRLAREIVRTDLGPDELLAGEVLETSRAGKVIGFAPRYMLRFAAVPMAENGAAKSSVDKVELGVRYQYDELVRRLRLEQPNLELVPVAAMTRRVNLRTTSIDGYRRPQGIPDEIDLRDAVFGRKRPQANRVLAEKADFRAHLEIAFANTGGGELVDPWRERTGNVSQFSDYIAGPDLRKLPKAYRLERERAEALIVRFYAAQDVEEEPVDVSYTEQQLDAALGLRRSLNYDWPLIAGVIGGSWQRARAAVIAYAKKKGVEVETKIEPKGGGGGQAGEQQG